MTTVNRVLSVAFLFLPSYLNAQTIVKGNISGLRDGSKVYLFSRVTQRQDSATVHRNRFAFQLNDVHGEVLYLMLTKDYVIGKFLPIYLDKGVLNIEGDDALLYKAKFTGSSYAIDLDDYNALLNSRHIVDDSWRIGQQMTTAIKNNDTITVAKLNQQLEQSRRDWKKLSDRWISTHLGSPISSFILYLTVYRDSSKQVLEEAMNKLTPEAKNNTIAKEMLSAIEASRRDAIGRVASDFTQTDAEGREVSLKDFRGKYVLVNFWASWCLPCRKENPELVKLFKKYKDRNFTIVDISLDKEKNNWIKAIHDDKLQWVNLSDLRFWANEVALLYNVKSIPANFLISPAGKILAKDLTGDDLDKFLEERL